MHQSSYVLSPDGDCLESHCHYEAIALGTMPITSLNPHFYSHLKGNAIFEEHRWNLTKLNERLPCKSEVNQRLIFEEYWMEYIEQIVGCLMHWWDPSHDVRCRLEKISNLVKNIAVEKWPNEPITDNDNEADIKHVWQENIAQASRSLHDKTKSLEMITLFSNTLAPNSHDKAVSWERVTMLDARPTVVSTKNKQRHTS